MAHQEPRSFAHVPTHLGYQICSVCGTIRLHPWTMTELSPSSIKQINQLDLAYMMTWLAVYTQHHAYWLPRILYSLIVHICKLKGPKRASWQLEPFGTMQGAEYPNLLKSYLEISCFTSSRLMSYLFLCGLFWTLGKDNKAKNVLKVRWLRPFSLDREYWLCVWFTGTGSSRWLDC